MKKEQSIQSVFNKLHKFSAKDTVAEPIKVELADVNELAQFTKQIMSQTSNIEDAHKSTEGKIKLAIKAKQEANSNLFELNRAVSKMEADIERLDGALSRFAADAKQLGINTKDIREAVVAEKAIALGKSTVKEYNNKISSFKSFLS